MLRLLEMKIASDEFELHSSMGAVLHGVLMEMLPNDAVRLLHEDGLRPFSQYVFRPHKSEDWYWRIGLLDDYFGQMIHEILEKRFCANRSIYLKNKRASVSLESFSVVNDTSYGDLVDFVYRAEQAPGRAELRFNTVASFKHDGRYMIFPDMAMIFKSLLNRWNHYSAEIKLKEENLGERLAELANITSYNLQTRYFGIENSNIKGFWGKVGINLHGNDMARRIIAVLLLFAQFSGIGVKTALGMGGIDVNLLYGEKKL